MTRPSLRVFPRHARALTVAISACIGAITACGTTASPTSEIADAASAPPIDTSDGDAALGPPARDSGALPPAESGAPDAGVAPTSPEPDAGGLSPLPADGTPTRRACTDAFGHELTKAYGRLDGVLVAVVPPGHKGCNGDPTHLHLQVEANAATYDVAVNVDGLYAEVEHAPMGAAWSEGWHPATSLDYPSELGLRAPAFSATDAKELEKELLVVNHISIYATGYGGAGIHLVHRNGDDHDGALVLDPLAPSWRFVAFRFAQQSF